MRGLHHARAQAASRVRPAEQGVAGARADKAAHTHARGARRHVADRVQCYYTLLTVITSQRFPRKIGGASMNTGFVTSGRMLHCGGVILGGCYISDAEKM